MLGALPFGLLVWRPALLAATSGAQRLITDQHAIAADAALTRALRRLILVGSVLFILTSLLFLMVQASSAAEVSLAKTIGAPTLQLLQGRSGLVWVILRRHYDGVAISLWCAGGGFIGANYLLFAIRAAGGPSGRASSCSPRRTASAGRAAPGARGCPAPAPGCRAPDRAPR